MKCNNCNCEIGTLTRCPYCGHQNLRSRRTTETDMYDYSGKRTTTRQSVYAYSDEPIGGQSTPTSQRRTSSYWAQPTTRSSDPPPDVRVRRKSREITTVEQLLRLILLVQCLIALLLTIQLILSGLSL